MAISDKSLFLALVQPNGKFLQLHTWVNKYGMDFVIACGVVYLASDVFALIAELVVGGGLRIALAVIFACLAVLSWRPLLKWIKGYSTDNLMIIPETNDGSITVNIRKKSRRTSGFKKWSKINLNPEAKLRRPPRFESTIVMDSTEEDPEESNAQDEGVQVIPLKLMVMKNDETSRCQPEVDRFNFDSKVAKTLFDMTFYLCLIVVHVEIFSKFNYSTTVNLPITIYALLSPYVYVLMHKNVVKYMVS